MGKFLIYQQSVGLEEAPLSPYIYKALIANVLNAVYFVDFNLSGAVKHNLFAKISYTSFKVFHIGALLKNYTSTSL